MKIQYVSDLHTEFLDYKAIKELAESITVSADGTTTLVLAGDIGTPYKLPNLFMFLDCVCDTYRYVIYIPGNHEYYADSQDLSEGIKVVRERQQSQFLYLKTAVQKSYSNLYWLDNEIVELDGCTIAGTTLWFADKKIDSLLKAQLNDYEMIGYDLVELSNKATAFITDLWISSAPVDLLITHHGVSPRVHPTFAGNQLNPFYYTDISAILQTSEIKAVVHGHQHFNHEYDIIRYDDHVIPVRMNAKGYPGQNTGFCPTQYITI